MGDNLSSKEPLCALALYFDCLNRRLRTVVYVSLMEPISYDVSRDRNGPTRYVASASAFPPTYATSSHTETPRVRSSRCLGVSAGTSWPVSIFFPAAFPAPGTTSPGMRAYDAAASRSNGGPHHRPTPLRSCDAGDMLRGGVPPWPRGLTHPAPSQGPYWTENRPLARPHPDRGHGSVSPSTMPRRLAAADGFWRPHAV